MEDHNLLIQEYADIVESLKEELSVCKVNKKLSKINYLQWECNHLYSKLKKC